MSECVVRMEFRKNCLDCDLHQIVYGDSYADTDVYCFKEKRYVGKRFGPIKDLVRPDWCPIICQLPEGHGQLVDAEKLKEHSVHFGETEYTFDFDAVFIEDINEAPIIVPAERGEI